MDIITKMTKDTIKPALASGFKDYLPDEMIPRQKMLDTIRAVFERFGYAPLDTPGLEKEEILTGGDPDFKMNIFKARINESGEDMALRFDLTVPLARVMAGNPELKKPFRRYQIGKVWRGERPHEIRINNRKILNNLYAIADFDKEKTNMVLRAMDKKDKQGWQKVEEELKNEGLSDKSISLIKEFTSKSETDDPELNEIASYLDAMDIPRSAWKIDLSVARGLGYYTGTVFETILTDLPSIGSVCSGGRYDGLTARFGGDSLPATGTSFGIDRLYAALSELGLVNATASIAKVIVLNFDEQSLPKCLSVSSSLRNNNISVELYQGSETSLTGQLTYAVKKGFSAAVIIGADEVDKNTVQIKNLKTKEQNEISDSDVITEIYKII
ncbi:MAG: Histidine-tRNA ligase [Candidatus Yanofskybacteria bacterium GW2011_GWA2_44_10]|nr:MAG: Histidine-tRNA ligase [Candidatus Yanofskybacteria bacterium GW2011_GWA2_44_10]